MARRRRLAANDTLYTVRWCAIRALAMLGDTDDVDTWLTRSLPHGLDQPPERWTTFAEPPWVGPGAFLRAAEACVAAGVKLVLPS